MTNNQNAASTEEVPAMTAPVDLRHISTEDLARLGVSKIAYVKPVAVDGAAAYAIHAADGTPMALAPDQAVAIAAIIQHEMVPALVH
jgi:hypothetical protein